MNASTQLPAGCMLIERDGLPPGCMLLKWSDGECDVVGADLSVRATVRFDPDVEAWAIFVHDVPHAPSAGARPRGRRLAAAAEPEKLLAALFEEAQLAEVA